MKLSCRAMKRLAALLLIVAFAACEKKPSAEELEALEEAKKAAEVKAAAAKASPTPKKGDWMLKDYKNPLEKRPTPR
jgi:hypothetical protein